MENIIEVRNLTKYFKTERLFGGAGGTVKAVDGVSFCLEKGRVLAIAGESGSGKTTIARCVAGLETRDSGDIMFENSPLLYDNPATRRRIQYVFQDTYSSLNPRIRIRDAVKEPIAFHFRASGKILDAAAKKCLEQVGLPAALLDSFPHELSGGQRQRVVIARALAMKPDVLIADEPVSSLDVSVQAQILKLFLELNRGGISIIFITHDLRIVKNLADSMIVLKDGRTAEEGPVEKIYAKPESDYTKLLLSSIPDSPYKY
jgi:peptide/nickel transport system ATP-binding protein